MFNLCNVLQFIIGRFNQGSFSGLNLVSNTYQGVSHAVLTLVTSGLPLKKETLEQSLTDISLVRT